jgi:hypothetical protein
MKAAVREHAHEELPSGRFMPEAEVAARGDNHACLWDFVDQIAVEPMKPHP